MRHRKAETRKRETAAPLARRVCRSLPISPVNSPTLFSRPSSESDTTEDLSIFAYSCRKLSYPSGTFFSQAGPSVGGSVLGESGSDGTRTRGLRRDRPAF